MSNLHSSICIYSICIHTQIHLQFYIVTHIIYAQTNTLSSSPQILQHKHTSWATTSTQRYTEIHIEIHTEIHTFSSLAEVKFRYKSLLEHRGNVFFRVISYEDIFSVMVGIGPRWPPGVLLFWAIAILYTTYNVDQFCTQTTMLLVSFFVNSLRNCQFFYAGCNFSVFVRC